MENRVSVKGKTIHGRDLKKLFEYYFEVYTKDDKYDVKYRNVSRLEKPYNPFKFESIHIDICINLLNLRNEWIEYFRKRRAIDEYWINRDSNN